MVRYTFVNLLWIRTLSLFYGKTPQKVNSRTDLSFKVWLNQNATGHLCFPVEWWWWVCWQLSSQAPCESCYAQTINKTCKHHFCHHYPEHHRHLDPNIRPTSDSRHHRQLSVGCEESRQDLITGLSLINIVVIQWYSWGWLRLMLMLSRSSPDKVVLARLSDQ